ncbi:hypothetical protein E2C01_023336 [Portunus trituberculatus]|uniref:Uncharacterized protein n=1 Tax=Portunus trituberculatus TaxID=210409 RepID=A0A5B7E7R7_PORTR|nr:hypothetical protein [Portunus trituberculatus]
MSGNSSPDSAVREEKRKEVEEEEEEAVPPTPHVAKIKSIQSAEVPLSLSPDRPFNREAISRNKLNLIPLKSLYVNQQFLALIDSIAPVILLMIYMV